MIVGNITTLRSTFKNKDINEMKTVKNNNRNKNDGANDIVDNVRYMKEISISLSNDNNIDFDDYNTANNDTEYLNKPLLKEIKNNSINKMNNDLEYQIYQSSDVVSPTSNCRYSHVSIKSKPT